MKYKKYNLLEYDRIVVGGSIRYGKHRPCLYEFIKKYKHNMFKPLLKKNILTVLEYLDKKNYLQLIVSAQEQGLLNNSVDYYNIKKYFSGVFGLKNNFAENIFQIIQNFQFCWFLEYLNIYE